MRGVDSAGTVLYRYLRMLSIKVSRITIDRLLNNPIGNSMRGMSEAMNALHIKNKVHQFESQGYFSQVEVPFITLSGMDRSEFCIVTKRDATTVELINEGGEKRQVKAAEFIEDWTGVVLTGESTSETPEEQFYAGKNILFYLLHYRLLLAVFLILVLGLQIAIYWEQSPAFIVYSCMMGFGILVSTAILYKERINERFMERFCHIGKIIDCNEVLHSKGGIVGGMRLGDLALLYFVILYLFSLVRWNDFYEISVILCGVGVVFTLYSIIHQAFILHKGCMLCMLVNLTIWSSVVVLDAMKNDWSMYTSFSSLFTFVIIGCICVILFIQLRVILSRENERTTLKQYFDGLLNPETFRMLLAQKPRIEEMINRNIALNNKKAGKDGLMIVINPNCKNCAKIHNQIRELSSSVSVSLVLITTPNDRLGEAVAQVIISAYFIAGWDKAIELLEEWYETKNIKDAADYDVTLDVKEVWRNQQVYCRSQKMKKTPSVFVNNHYVPEVYSLSHFKYVLA